MMDMKRNITYHVHLQLVRTIMEHDRVGHFT